MRLDNKDTTAELLAKPTSLLKSFFGAGCVSLEEKTPLFGLASQNIPCAILIETDVGALSHVRRWDEGTRGVCVCGEGGGLGSGGG